MDTNPVTRLALLVLCLPVVYTFTKYVYNLLFHPLRGFPGPKHWAMSWIPCNYQSYRGRLHLAMKDLHEVYGPVVRIGPHNLDYDCSEAWEDIYGFVKGDKQKAFEKQKIYYGPTYTGAPHIIQANNEDHRRLRRLQSHAFSEKALLTQESYLQHYGRAFIKGLQKQVGDEDSGVVDIVKWYNFSAFDLIGDLAFAHSFQCVENGELHPWVAAVFDSIAVMMYLYIARLYPWFEWMLNFFIPQSMKDMRTNHFKWSAERVEERLNITTDRKDFMSYMMREQGEKGMTDDEFKEAAGILVMAGSETSATLLAGLTYILLKNPEIREKLAQEVRSEFATKEMTLTNLAQLKYLNACIEEGLRMFPPAPTAMPRVVPKGGAIIYGQFVPEDTVVGVTQYAANHTSRNFKDPEKFLPERWLGGAEFESDDRKACQPFSYGPRNCIGRNLAYAEMRLLLANLLWNFDIELHSDSKNWLAECKVYNLWEKPPMKVILTPRVV